jgi:hypothetical protein
MAGSLPGCGSAAVSRLTLPVAVGRLTGIIAADQCRQRGSAKVIGIDQARTGLRPGNPPELDPPHRKAPSGSPAGERRLSSVASTPSIPMVIAISRAKVRMPWEGHPAGRPSTSAMLAVRRSRCRACSRAGLGTIVGAHFEDVVAAPAGRPIDMRVEAVAVGVIVVVRQPAAPSKSQCRVKFTPGIVISPQRRQRCTTTRRPTRHDTCPPAFRDRSCRRTNQERQA